MELFGILVVEWIGYIASLLILISLVMRSIKRLRLINLAGASIFTVYGFLIQAYPVAVMNAGIVLINLYYLRQMIRSRDYFKVIAVEKTDEYLKAFVAFYRENIQEAMPFTETTLNESSYRFFILRNMNPAGLFVVKEYDDKTLEITLDYAIPMYQDFKTGAHVFKKTGDVFKDQGYEQFITFTADDSHQNYLKRMQFTRETIDGKNAYLKKI